MKDLILVRRRTELETDYYWIDCEEVWSESWAEEHDDYESEPPQMPDDWAKCPRYIAQYNRVDHTNSFLYFDKGEGDTPDEAIQSLINNAIEYSKRVNKYRVPPMYQEDFEKFRLEMGDINFWNKCEIMIESEEDHFLREIDELITNGQSKD
jgi:hypothetical protein